MITVPEAAKKIIQRSRFLSEALSKDLINHSSLARYIKPELEEMLKKEVSDASVLMAIQRISKEFKPHYYSEDIFKQPTTIKTRSNLFLVTYLDKNFPDWKSSNGIIFIRFSPEETTLIAENNFEKIIRQNIKKKVIKETVKNLGAITVGLSPEAAKNPGKHYFFLKSLAWEGISVLDVFTISNEITFIIEEKDLKNSLGIIQSLFAKIEV